jgi:type IV secretion system protein VirB10
VVADDPEPLGLPELPPPEPRIGYTPPTPEPYVPPAPATPPPPTPEEIARERRLSAPLSGAGAGSAAVDASGAGRGSDPGRGGIDLATTRTATAFARRLSDMTFLLPKGTYIPCILDTAIQSDQAGMVACTLPRDVYGADGTVVLLDRGAQVLGEYRTATLTYGKRRIFAVWDRVRTPEGVVVDIASPGTGPLGRAGMGGKIDNHYWQRVGIPVLMSAVSFGTESWAREQLTSDQAQWIEQTTNDSLSTVLAEFAKIKPTLHKHQGATINILVARDVDLTPVYRLSRR